MSYTQSSNKADKSKKSGADSRLLYLILGAVTVLGVLIWSYYQRPDKSIPSEKGVIYYTGVRYNNRNGKWVDANGRIAPRPPGETEPPPPPKDALSIPE